MFDILCFFPATLQLIFLQLLTIFQETSGKINGVSNRLSKTGDQKLLYYEFVIQCTLMVMRSNWIVNHS